jgi:hypothetical protein
MVVTARFDADRKGTQSIWARVRGILRQVLAFPDDRPELTPALRY